MTDTYRGTLFFSTVLGIALMVGHTSIADARRPQPATEAENREALLANARCLYRQAAMMDDGISDAATIGSAIAPACSQSWNVYVELQGRHLSSLARQMLRNRMADDPAQVATSMVLARRAGQVSDEVRRTPEDRNPPPR